MPHFHRGPATVHYEEYGVGYPVLLLALGSLNSSIAWWSRDSTPMNPIDDLRDRFRMVAMDQRNAGRSWAPIGPGENWDSYTRDQIALLDHLGIARAHLVGQCIGGPLTMNFLRMAPERVQSAALLQPSGRTGPLLGRRPSFDQWVATLTDHPEADGVKPREHAPHHVHSRLRVHRAPQLRAHLRHSAAGDGRERPGPSLRHRRRAGPPRPERRVRARVTGKPGPCRSASPPRRVPRRPHPLTAPSTLRRW